MKYGVPVLSLATLEKLLTLLPILSLGLAIFNVTHQYARRNRAKDECIAVNREYPPLEARYKVLMNALAEKKRVSVRPRS